ncbi:hypoxia-inducible factor 1-alpha inhibitor isoform X1 [Dendrobium catenatum]|uniref:hypoxia-inducible factor 1-alpha inhibitor isoform X1 n=1 Tax=Dendrobium catenatum TaxID=906689 RepID=UPI00109F1829|nr:hypoxia-inducible factor 1-alpha inhibitor isoform X1 [Dendrobium catenatum]
MAQLEDALRIRHFRRLPSSEEFSAEIEPSNVPAVFYGAIKGWEAISKWNPSKGGLDYLQERAGSAVVEAMLSKSAPVFYGDLRSHERVPVPFSTFITSCKSYQKEASTSNKKDMDMELAYSKEEQTSLLDIPDFIYLAQVPILSAKIEETCPLEILRGDLEMPNFLGNNTIESINLWMNRASSRSSTHYDPHHNLLCIVAGCKRVVLWAPSSSPLLYPMPVYGEASNHSAVDLVNPDFSVHGRALTSKEYSQEIVLHYGDALFIPEGWFHQVDSHDLTVAVNFWWKSCTISNMVEHMDAYYLRRILSRLVDKEMNDMLRSLEGCSKGGNHAPKTDVLKGDSYFESNDPITHAEQSILASDPLEPHELNVLYQIVSLVHENLSPSSHGEASGFTPKVSGINVDGDQKSNAAMYSSIVLNNPVASILWAVDPLALQKVILSMVNRFPRTLEALIIHMLSPTAAEVLTRKFDEMDKETTKEQQSEFYQQFYSVFDDQYAAMDSILHGKEFFSFQAFCNVLDKYLGVSVDENRTYHQKAQLRSDRSGS